MSRYESIENRNEEALVERNLKWAAERELKEVKQKLNNAESKLKLFAIPDVRLALITFEGSKHKFLSEKCRHEYAVKVVDEYLGNL